MSDPRLPLEEPDDLGDIEDIEDTEGPDDPVDAGGGEDEPDQAAESSEDEGEEEEQVARRPTRGESRQARLSRENRELRNQLTTFQTQLDEIRSRPAAVPVDPYAQARAQQAEAERIANMTYEERVDYLRARDRQEVANALQQSEFRISDRLDKAQWDAAKRTDRTRARLSDRVEQVLQSERAAGRNTDREVIFTYLYGQEMLGKRGQVTDRQRGQATRRVARQTTRPVSGRGGEGRTGNGRAGGEDADLRFLKNTRVGDVI